MKEPVLKDIWIVSSAPLHIRVSHSFLLSLRYLLIQWGYSKSQVRVDDQAMILKIDGEECCSAFSFESEFKVIWQGQFESWIDLQNDGEVLKWSDTAKSKLRRAGGKGKGGGGGGGSRAAGAAGQRNSRSTAVVVEVVVVAVVVVVVVGAASLADSAASVVVSAVASVVTSAA